MRKIISMMSVSLDGFIEGRGKPMFPPSDAVTDLRLASSRIFGNGVVLLDYQRPRAPGP